MALGVDGLVSGLDTTSIISGLMAVEARPQTLLKNQLTQAQAKATAYRAVNTRFDAIRTAAEALTSANLTAAKTAKSSSATVTTTATLAANAGDTITFDVVTTAKAHSVVLDSDFTSKTDPLPSPSQPAWPIEVHSTDGSKVGRISLPPNASLADAVAAVNASSYGLKATIIQVEPGHYRLQVAAAETGGANAFTLTQDDGMGTDTQVPLEGYSLAVQGSDAELDLGLSNGVLARSATNTFTDLIPGTTITVSKVEYGATVSVGSDDSAIAAKVQALVDAANGALGLMKSYSTSTTGQATATLQGDRALVQLSDQVLSAVSSAIGGKSASTIGLQLTRDGKITFDAAAFTAKLGSDPTGVTELLSGTTGIAGKLAALAKTASDSSTGTLVQLATGRDTLAKAIQDKVDAFDVRLEARRATLTAQFTALERSLNTIKNQSSWLSQQIGQLYNPNAS